MSDEIEDNGAADVVAALSLISLALLGAIHFVYTGGLPAFFGLFF